MKNTNELILYFSSAAYSVSFLIIWIRRISDSSKEGQVREFDWAEKKLLSVSVVGFVASALLLENVGLKIAYIAINVIAVPMGVIILRHVSLDFSKSAASKLDHIDKRLLMLSAVGFVALILFVVYLPK